MQFEVWISLPQSLPKAPLYEELLMYGSGTQAVELSLSSHSVNLKAPGVRFNSTGIAIDFADQLLWINLVVIISERADFFINLAHYGSLDVI